MWTPPQLSLTESDVSKIGAIKVEAIINPTNADMDLKDGVGEQSALPVRAVCASCRRQTSSS